MKLYLCLAAFAALIVSAAPAAAQKPDELRQLPQRQAVHELGIFANCIAVRRTDRARALALAPYDTAEQQQAADRVMQRFDDVCLRGGFGSVRMSVRHDMLAGAVARVLLNREYPNLAQVIDPTTVDVASERLRAAQLGVPERFGRCVVWNDPAGVQALLRADPGSPAEAQAINGLKQDMGMCLEEGHTLRLDRSFVRNVTAVAAYKLAQQVRPGAPARSAAE